MDPAICQCRDQKTEFNEALAVGVNGYIDSSDKPNYELKLIFLIKKSRFAHSCRPI